MSVMCNISCRFSKEFFAVKPLKHIGLSDMDSEHEHEHEHEHELEHEYELGTEGYFKSLAE